MAYETLAAEAAKKSAYAARLERLPDWRIASDFERKQILAAKTGNNVFADAVWQLLALEKEMLRRGLHNLQKKG